MSVGNSSLGVNFAGAKFTCRGEDFRVLRRNVGVLVRGCGQTSPARFVRSFDCSRHGGRGCLTSTRSSPPFSNVMATLRCKASDPCHVCRGEDSNPHALRHQLLKLARIPVSPPRRSLPAEQKIYTFTAYWY